MKLYMKSLTLLLFLGTVASCNDSFLDQTQTSDLNRETVFADSTYTANFLTGIYTDIGFDINYNRWTYLLANGGGLQSACDEAEFYPSSTIWTNMMFATGTVNPVTVSDDAWSKCYTNIRRCNVFLANIDRSPMVQSRKAQYISEALFLRAWYYFILMKHYGGVPIIGNNVYDATSTMKTSRNTWAECVEYVSHQCDSIVQLNVLPVRRTGQENGRASSAAALGLKARVCLYAASPLFNGSDFAPTDTKELVGYPSYDKERWKTAMDAARAVINLGTYNLFIRSKDLNGKAEPGFGFYVVFQAGDTRNANLTDDDGKNNNGAFAGNILDRKYQRESGHEAAYYPPSGSHSGTRHGGYIYKELADAFPMIDGKPINNSQYTFDPLNPAQNRDPRFNNTVIYDGALVPADDTYSATTVVNTWIGVGQTSDAVYQGTATGFYVRKGCDRLCKGSTWNPSRHNDPLIRYADILLMYAEALNELTSSYDVASWDGGTTYTISRDINEMKKGVQPVRIRAGLHDYTATEYADASLFRAKLKRERQIEFFAENQRYFDLRRWMDAPEEESLPVYGFNVLLGENKRDDFHRPIVIQDFVCSFSDKMWFWPINYTELKRNSKLTQNPGWTYPE